MTDVSTNIFQQLMMRARMWMSGIQFNGARDLYQQFGYPRITDHRNYIAMYQRQGLAKRIIDLPVLATWADPPVLEVDGNAEWMEGWSKVVREQELWHNFIRLDKLAGLGRYACLLVGFDDGAALDTPVRAASGRKVIYVQPYHERCVAIAAYDTDPKSPRFGLPMVYRVNPALDNVVTSSINASVTAPRQPFSVHWTRMVHVAEGMTEDRVFGQSRLEPLFNDLSDMLKVTGASAETFWLIVNRGFQIDVDKDMDFAPEDASELQQEIEDYQHQLRRFIRTRGVKIENLGHDQVDPSGVYRVIASVICAGCGIPQSILFGGGTNHGGSDPNVDRANWSDRVAERVSEYAHPIVLMRFIRCITAAGVLPDVGEEIDVEWPEAFNMSPLERAQTSAQMARSAVNLMKAHKLSGGDTSGITGQDGGIGQKGSTYSPDPSGGGGTKDAPGNTPQGESGGGGAPKPVQPMHGQPAGQKPLFSRDEMRQIVSFGKHPPAFDPPKKKKKGRASSKVDGNKA